MIRRSAIAGGALLWATPVVQSLGNDSAYAWFRGSQKPGHCHCNARIQSIIPTECHADPGPKHGYAPSGKSVTLQVLTSAGCGGGDHCQPDGELISWTQVSASHCALVAQSDDTCVVHVTDYPASITLQVSSTLTCAGPRGSNSSSCSDTKVRRICFSQVTGSQSQRCGRYPPHVNLTHGTEPCT